MTATNATGVVGVDGQSPVYDPSARWCIWGYNDIYLGASGNSKYVPKVNDFVIEPTTFTTYIVLSLDPITLIPTLKEIRPANMSFSFTETDVLFGVGPGTQSDTYRAYLDKSTLPHVLAIDARLKVNGSMVNYAKIFRGSSLGSNAIVISKVYDSQGMFVSENVLLETVAIDSHTNYAVKSVPPCNIVEDLPDSEVVTAVFYDTNGNVVSKRQLLVENTTFIRPLNASMKYVTHIALKSPFMSPTGDNSIDYPLNVPLNALNLIGQVYYSDGSILELPVDGTKFSIFGLDQFTSSIIGQQVGLVLSYSLSENEASYAGVGALSKTITEAYTLRTINPNNSYTVKLFGYPFWIDDVTGYQMRWWMLNMDRNVFFEVTNYVNFDQNTGPFDPKGYGYLQRKNVSLNLRDVSGAFKPFIHSQLVEIVLNGNPQVNVNPWTVSNDPSPKHNLFGPGLAVKKVSDTVINLSNGFNILGDWLQNVYLNTYPLINPSTEVNPLTPSHFVLTYNGVDTEYNINTWSNDLTLSEVVYLTKTVTLRFIKRTSSGDLQLAVAAMMIK